MKFNKLSQLFLVLAAGLILASLFTACQLVNIDFVYVAASAGSAGSNGQIYSYETDGSSGALRTGHPTISSGGTIPVAMADTSDGFNLYVANAGNDSVVHFDINIHGVLTQKESITLPNTPVAIAVSESNDYLFAVSGTTSATLTEYPLSKGVIGAASASVPLTLAGYPSDTIVPTGVIVLTNNNAVYVTAYDQSAYNPGGTTTSNANPGWVFGFTIGSGGALAPVPAGPYQAGVKPVALASDPVSRFVYVTDFASNELIGYTVQSDESLNFMVNGPFKTGDEPSAVTIDPRGIYIYVANSLDSSVSAYTISLPTGTPSATASTSGAGASATDSYPVAIVVEPALARYVYTANKLGNDVSGFRLTPNTGVINTTLASPYPTGDGPTALVAIAHGNHATQSVAP
ncbi:MAG: beta-propeller fold lactonase family protein [Terracidiphilus sp.]|jgi:6-phosphogluconolactonase (cycloisomerase 2 family)